MSKLFRISLVLLGILAGMQAAQAVHPDDKPTVLDEIIEEQSKGGA